MQITVKEVQTCEWHHALIDYPALSQAEIFMTR